MDDTFLMGMMDSFADMFEQLQSLLDIQFVLVAVRRDGRALDIFHDEVGPAGFRRPGVKYMGNIRMIQQRQGLSFGLEAGDNLLGIHAGLDDFQRDPAFNRLFLLSLIDQTHAALAN